MSNQVSFQSEKAQVLYQEMSSVNSLFQEDFQSLVLSWKRLKSDWDDSYSSEFEQIFLSGFLEPLEETIIDNLLNLTSQIDRALEISLKVKPLSTFQIPLSRKSGFSNSKLRQQESSVLPTQNSFGPATFLTLESAYLQLLLLQAWKSACKSSEKAMAAFSIFSAFTMFLAGGGGIKNVNLAVASPQLNNTSNSSVEKFVKLLLSDKYPKAVEEKKRNKRKRDIENLSNSQQREAICLEYRA